MPRPWFLLLLASFAGAVSPTSTLAAARPVAVQDTTRGGTWRADLEFLVRELEVRHADFYHAISREEFHAALAALERRIDTLSDAGVLVEIDRLLARIGDGHTGLFLPWDRGVPFHRLPLELYAARDGWIVVGARQDLAELLGARVLRFGRGDADSVLAAVRPLLPRDNDERPRDLASYWVVLPEVLRALGFSDDDVEVPLTFELADGTRREWRMSGVERGTKVEYRSLGGDAAPAWFRRRDETYWSERREAGALLWVAFNSADIGVGAPEEAFSRFCDAIVDTVRAAPPRRMVVDLRWNAGGSYPRTVHLLRAIVRSELFLPPGALWVLVSPRTFSAGTSIAVDLERFTRARFAGGPTGGRPNAFGDIGRITLPRHGAVVRYSRYNMAGSVPWDTRPAVFPEVLAEPSVADLRAGRDPVLAALSTYVPANPLLPAFQAQLDAHGVSSAVAWLEALASQANTSIDLGEAGLVGVSNLLVQRREPQLAVQVLRLAGRRFPWSARVWNRLGQALGAAGAAGDSLAAFQRAFELDRRYTRWREVLPPVGAATRPR